MALDRTGGGLKKHRKANKLRKNKENQQKLKKSNKNYLRFGRPHRLTSDEHKEERKRGTQYERKSLKSRKDERIGTEKSDERKRGTKEERKSLKKCISTKP